MCNTWLYEENYLQVVQSSIAYIVLYGRANINYLLIYKKITFFEIREIES